MKTLNISELRLGNKIKTFGNIVELDESLFSAFLLHSEYIKLYQGIPLTEEWLLKFGFVDKDKWFYKSDFMLGYITADNRLQTEIKFAGAQHAWKILDIKYVHQLQNLYFALTRHELIFPL